MLVHLAPSGGIPEWPKGTDCKSVGTAFEGSNPSPPTIHAHVAQSVEHVLGKDEVVGSIPIVGSIFSAERLGPLLGARQGMQAIVFGGF